MLLLLPSPCRVPAQRCDKNLGPGIKCVLHLHANYFLPVHNPALYPIYNTKVILPMIR